MNNFFKRFALMAVAALSVVSCQEVVLEEGDIAPKEVTAVLYASTPSEDPSSKIGFTENAETSSIDLSWELEDAFTLYSSDDTTTALAVFTCTDADEGKFETTEEGFELVEGEEYTAKYNESPDLSTQNGDAIGNLSDACEMEVTFTYGTDAIRFSHTKAVVTFKFADLPSVMVFENGDDVYTVNYSELTADGEGTYTSYIMIEPCEAVERTLRFSLYSDVAAVYELTTSKAYEKGYRYTATPTSYTQADLGYDINSDTYEIYSATGLKNFAGLVNAGNTTINGTLTTNIDLSSVCGATSGISWTPIGNDSAIYTGVFDGGNHEVSNLYINNATSSYQGLFGYVKGATVKNLGVDGEVTGCGYTAGVVGFAASSNSYIINCYNKATINGNCQFIGGITGFAQASDIISCYNTGDVTGGDTNTGGIAGRGNRKITSCYNTGNVTSGHQYTGGISGYAGDITSCYNTGSVSSANANLLGAITGSATTISYCYYDSSTVNASYDNQKANTPSTAQAATVADSETVTGLLTSQMTTDSFVALLNNGAYYYNSASPTVIAYG